MGGGRGSRWIGVVVGARNRLWRVVRRGSVGERSLRVRCRPCRLRGKSQRGARGP